MYIYFLLQLFQKANITIFSDFLPVSEKAKLLKIKTPFRIITKPDFKIFAYYLFSK